MDNIDKVKDLQSFTEKKSLRSYWKNLERYNYKKI